MLCLIFVTIFIVYQTDKNEQIHKITIPNESKTTLSESKKEPTEKMLKSISTTEGTTEIPETLKISENSGITVVQEKIKDTPTIIEQTKPNTNNSINVIIPTEQPTKPEIIVPPTINQFAPIEPTESTETIELTKPTEITPTYPETNTSETINLGVFTLTAYCPCYDCCGKWSEFGLTYTGTVPEQGRTIAVDPDVIPYGTQVIINGHTYIAEDCGSAIKNNKIDIFFNNHVDALNFGMQTAEIEIIRTI
jgi:3D (Asp-Asp-Asp) domain-containing protein